MSGPAAVASARRVALVSLAYGAVLAGGLVLSSGGDVSRLVHAAPPFTDARRAPSSLTVSPDSADGFDGQFYFRLAVRPLSDDPQVAGVSFDLPALRTQRILYPLAGRAVALGDEQRLPWAMLIVNVLALGAVGWLGALLALEHGRAAAWGLLFAAYPGFVYTLGFDLAELVEAALVLGGLLLVARRRYLVAGLALAAATLAKEPACILPLGIGLAWAWGWLRHPRDERPPVAGLFPAVIPGVAFAAWQLVVGARFDALPMVANADNNIRYPLDGLISSAARFSPTSGANLFRDLSLALLVVVAALSAMAWRRSTAILGARLAWVTSTALLLVISEHVYDGATSFMRAGTESYVVGLVVVLGSNLSAASLLVPATGVVTVATVAAELVKAGG